jgi:phosphate acetyltransferase
MAHSLYIAGIEPGSGKSLVALGVMEMLLQRVRQIGYFRPVIPSKEIPDNNIQLIDNRYHLESSYEEMYAFIHDDAQAMVGAGASETSPKEIFNKYKTLESKC